MFRTAQTFASLCRLHRPLSVCRSPLTYACSIMCTAARALRCRCACNASVALARRSNPYHVFTGSKPHFVSTRAAAHCAVRPHGRCRVQRAARHANLKLCLAPSPIPCPQVPLRIALTDHTADAESNELLAADAPWSARLAARLLRERAKGASSPYSAYINALPPVDEAVSPAQWPWELVARLKYDAAAAHLHETSWVVESAAAGLRGAAVGLPEGAELGESEKEAFRCAGPCSLHPGCRRRLFLCCGPASASAATVWGGSGAPAVDRPRDRT